MSFADTSFPHFRPTMHRGANSHEYRRKGTNNVNMFMAEATGMFPSNWSSLPSVKYFKELYDIIIYEA